MKGLMMMIIMIRRRTSYSSDWTRKLLHWSFQFLWHWRPFLCSDWLTGDAVGEHPPTIVAGANREPACLLRVSCVEGAESKAQAGAAGGRSRTTGRDQAPSNKEGRETTLTESETRRLICSRWFHQDKISCSSCGVDSQPGKGHRRRPWCWNNNSV